MKQNGGAFFLMLVQHQRPLCLFFAAYRISPQFVNVTGNFLNSCFEVFQCGWHWRHCKDPFESPLVGLGTPVNNRQAIELQVDGQLLNCHVNVGLGLASEISPTDGGISYFHLVNGETISRLNLFTQAWGPYNALNSVYRRTFEVASLSDSIASDGAPFKSDSIRWRLKSKSKEVARSKVDVDVAVSHQHCTAKLGVAASTCRAFAAEATESSIDLGYEVNERVVILAHVGLERVVGNDEAASGDADGPSSLGQLWRWLNLGSGEWQTMARNQTHRRLGAGLDLSLTDAQFVCPAPMVFLQRPQLHPQSIVWQ